MGAAASTNSLFSLADHWFDQARVSLGNELPCRQGCSSCCIGPFPVTQLDMLELRRGLTLLPDDHRVGIQSRAAEQVAELEQAYPELRTDPSLDGWKDQTIDRLVAQFADRPCPALQADGSCGVYAFRPITCRMMGVPTEADGIVQGACTVQTFVPIARLSAGLRSEEDEIARLEGEALDVLRQIRPAMSEEILLPYAFCPDRATGR
ncbi:MAG: YkgJ family cysteine cluster protein [Nitrospiraceae bacterium]|nr:YkgJ family cysteine cluster protein [Nitrospiraceae bacterium]